MVAAAGDLAVEDAAIGQQAAGEATAASAAAEEMPQPQVGDGGDDEWAAAVAAAAERAAAVTEGDLPAADQVCLLRPLRQVRWMVCAPQTVQLRKPHLDSLVKTVSTQQLELPAQGTAVPASTKLNAQLYGIRLLVLTACAGSYAGGGDYGGAGQAGGRQ